MNINRILHKICTKSNVFFIVKGMPLLQHSSSCTCISLPDDGQHVRLKQAIKCKGLPQQTEVAQGVLGRLRPRIFLTFGTTRVVGRQPYTPAAYTPGEIPGTHF